MLAGVAPAPRRLVATECWPPNLDRARRNLAPLGAAVIAMADELDDLPFLDSVFDLVVSRHPVGIRWDEIARVLKPGGSYLSQDVGHGSVGELTDFLMGQQPEEDGPTRDPIWSVRGAPRGDPGLSAPGSAPGSVCGPGLFRPVRSARGIPAVGATP